MPRNKRKSKKTAPAVKVGENAENANDPASKAKKKSKRKKKSSDAQAADPVAGVPVANLTQEPAKVKKAKKNMYLAKQKLTDIKCPTCIVQVL